MTPIGKNYSGTEVHSATQQRVAHIVPMGDLRAFSDHTVLQFAAVADNRAVTDHHVLTNPASRPDPASFPDPCRPLQAGSGHDNRSLAYPDRFADEDTILLCHSAGRPI